MKIWIVYSNKVYQTKIEAKEFPEKMANQYQIYLEIKNHDFFDFKQHNSQTGIFYKNQELTDLPDCVLMRVNDVSLASNLEKLGIKVVNSSAAISNSCDKYKTFQILKKNNILTPNTIKISHGSSYSEVCAELNASIFVLKTSNGSKGDGVYLIQSEEAFIGVLAKEASHVLIAQEYIESSYGRDIRVIILNNKFLKSIIRENPADFKSNLATGGTFTNFDCPDDVKKIALETCEKLGLDFAGIDILFGKEEGEYYICEANSNPGIKMEGYIDNLEIVVRELAEFIGKEPVNRLHSQNL